MIYTVSEEFAGKRLDSFLASVADLSRTAAAKLIESGAVTLNGKPADKKDILTAGDEVEAVIPAPEEYSAEPENIPLDIVFEDGDLIVINKPSGMVVHPAPGNYSGTLVNALLYHCKDSLSGIGGVMRPGIVHRIDKDTSGLLVVAKNDKTHLALSEELSYHGIVREYRALVNGKLAEDKGTVDLPIGRHPVDRKKMAVIRGGGHAREAITHFEVLERFPGVTYVKLILETGRTHQIRVHMAALGHPLLGDEVYGGGKTRFEKLHSSLLSGQALHAKCLTFTHPSTGERMTFSCDLPPEFEKLLTILRNENKND